MLSISGVVMFFVVVILLVALVLIVRWGLAKAGITVDPIIWTIVGLLVLACVLLYFFGGGHSGLFRP